MDSIKCSKCKGSMKYVPDSDVMKCSYCGNQQAIETEYNVPRDADYYMFLRELEKRLSNDDVSLKTCLSCSASFELNWNENLHICPYCNQGIPDERKVERIHKAEFILPFQVSKDAIKEKFAAYLGQKPLSPGIESFQIIKDSIRGCYIPSYSFNVRTNTTYGARKGKYVSYGDTKILEWEMVSGEIDEYFKNLTVAAGLIERQKFEGLGKWDFDPVEPLSSHYMKDYSCETFTKSVGKAFSECEKNITSAAILEKQMGYMIGGDKQEITGTSLRYTTIGFKHVLLPIWSFNVIYNNKEYHVYMNGQSGRVSAKLPAARHKVMLIAGGICAAIAGLVFLFMSGAYVF